MLSLALESSSHAELRDKLGWTPQIYYTLGYYNPDIYNAVRLLIELNKEELLLKDMARWLTRLKKRLT